MWHLWIVSFSSSVYLRFYAKLSDCTTKRSLWNRTNLNVLKIKIKFPSHMVYKRTHTSRQLFSMSDRTISSLFTLPIEFVNRILDHLSDFNILCSMRNVCTRINAIVDIYHRYQVNFFFISNYLQNIIYSHYISYLDNVLF